ncbi:unnamed protein product [Lupinus luteus]|uniref:Uncharacterized protein n=1 Tax=Lupinus luteus TaxID=3873 RepID=A0AAV1Y9Y2_LUPLU
MLREAYKPKDLIVPPDSLYVSDSMAWITEYTLIKGWMAQWLNYVLWYNIVAVDPGVLLQYFLDAPVVARHLKVSRTDPQLTRLNERMFHRPREGKAPSNQGLLVRGVGLINQMLVSS